jgi:hypothetical protein
MFIPRFFFEDGAEGAGGAGGAEPNAGAAAASAAPVDVPESIITAEELKNYGIDRDQLRTILQSHKENAIPAEQKEKEAQVNKATFIKYAAEKGLMKVEDFNSYESLKNKSDRDLRFESYLKEWREDNPEVTDAEEIQSQAKSDFENEFRLNSENAAQKARGEARLKKEAEELRSPLTSKYQSAEAAYNREKAMLGKIPDFNKFVDTLIEKCTPDKLSVSKVKDGEEEIQVEVELSKKDREELSEHFRTAKTYAAYENGEKDLSKVEAGISKKINGYLREKYHDQIVGKAFELGKGRGVVKGSNVGSEQPFSVIKGQAPGKDGNNVLSLEKSNEKIAAARARYAK